MKTAKALAVLVIAVIASGCATARELNGTWMVTVGRYGTCRVIEHRSETEQLDTRTVWRGEGCAAVEAVRDEPAGLEVSP